MNDRPEGDVALWRGFDPEWNEYGGMICANLLVRAPCEEVARILRRNPGMPKRISELLADDSPPSGVCEEPLYVYQLREHEWTQVEADDVVLGSDLPQDLSRQMSTLAYARWFDPSSSGSAYVICENGELIEAYGVLADNPTSQGPEGEADLRRKLAEGWQFSRDHTFEFFSKRGTKLDIESPEECHTRWERAAEELGMFVACRPWTFNPKLRQVERGRGWTPEDFAAAIILYRAG